MPKLGSKSTCKDCGKEVEYVGPYWRHTTYSPRHMAIPIIQKPGGKGESKRNDG